MSSIFSPTQEQNNYPKAIAISTAILVVFVLLSLFLIISTSKPEEVGTGGLIVNYGTSDVGLGNDYMSIEEPSVDPNANNTPPDKVIPNQEPQKNVSAQATDKNIVTQDVEDAPEVTTTTKKNNSAPTTSTETKESKPTLNPNALYKGKKNNGTGLGDGTGNTPGNQGKKEGDPLSNSYSGTGSGNGGVALSLANRRFLTSPRIDDNGQQSGKIAVTIQVDRSGTVIKAEAGARGTTLTDISLWDKCEKAVLGAKLNTLESAPDIQQGVVVFNFKVR